MDELDVYYTVLRALSAAFSFSAAALVILKNKNRWRRDSSIALRFGARLWREMLILLMTALGVTYVTAALKHAPGVPATVYMPVILGLFVYGLWAEYRDRKARMVYEASSACPKRRFDDE